MDANTPATPPTEPIPETPPTQQTDTSTPAPAPTPAPTPAPAPTSAPTPAPAPTSAPAPPIPDRSAVQDSGRTPTRPTGPNASPIVLGLVAVVLGTLIIANETMTWSVDWSGLGPGAIVVIGVVLLVIGAIGLARRRDDV